MAIVRPAASLPSLNILAVLLVLAVFNSAVAFLIWNHALTRLQAFEISVTGNLMPIGTAVLAPILIGEAVSNTSWAGIVITFIGVVIVGLGGVQRRKASLDPPR